MCDSIAINVLRGTVTDVMNMFGQSGFDSTLFDQARNKCLMRLAGLIKDANNYKISNIRLESSVLDPSLITINAYGTLLKKAELQTKKIIQQ